MRLVFAAWRDLAHPQAGGAEALIDRLACGMLARGHEVALMCGGPVGPRPYPVVDLGGTYGQYLRAPFEHRRRFRHWDLLIDTENGLPYFAPLWRRGPVICLVHHVHTDQWGDRFPGPVAAVGRVAEARLMPFVYGRTRFVAVSPSTGRALANIGVPESRITVAPLNGVGPPALKVPRQPEPLFAAIGRLVPHKRFDTLLELWPEIRRQTGGSLVVAGDGPERSRLESLRSEGVVLLGRVSEEEKWALLSRAWVIVHPARHEGWGAVILEAGAVGTPAVGFDVAGVRDAIENGVSGWLVNSPEEFALRWVELAKREDLRARMAQGALRQAARFSWNESFDRFEELVLTVGQGLPTPRPARWQAGG